MSCSSAFFTAKNLPACDKESITNPCPPRMTIAISTKASGRLELQQASHSFRQTHNIQPPQTTGQVNCRQAEKEEESKGGELHQSSRRKSSSTTAIDTFRKQREATCSSPRVVSLVLETHKNSYKRTGSLGLSLSETEKSDTLKTTRCFYILAIEKDSPADRCGQLFLGDAIKTINGLSVDWDVSFSELKRLLKEAGERVTLGVQHVSGVLLPGGRNFELANWRARDGLGLQWQSELTRILRDDSGGLKEEADKDEQDCKGADTLDRIDGHELQAPANLPSPKKLVKLRTNFSLNSVLLSPGKGAASPNGKSLMGKSASAGSLISDLKKLIRR